MIVINGHLHIISHANDDIDPCNATEQIVSKFLNFITTSISAETQKVTRMSDEMCPDEQNILYMSFTDI